MTYIDDIFRRAHTQQICSFLLSGVECRNAPGDYEQRISTASDALFTEIHTYDSKTRETLEALATEALDTRERVFLEIGIRIGLGLAK